MIRVYKLEDCSYCNTLLNLLDREGIVYESIDADSYEHEGEVEALEDFLNTSLYPIVIIRKGPDRIYLASGDRSTTVDLGDEVVVTYVSIPHLFNLIKNLI